jgi:beta-exotoxin I transport system permease protein
MTALRLELRRSRSLTIWLGVSLGGYGVIMGLMYPILKANDALMSEYMNTFPKEFLAAFGMTGVLSDPGVFYTTYISSWLWPIIAAAAALLIGTRAAADLDRGFLDLPLSTRITRVRYLSVSIVGQAIVMVLLAACAVLGLWGAGRLVGAEFDLGRFAMAGVLSLAFGCAILGATTLAAVLTLSRGTASGIVGGALIVMYVIFVVGQVSPDWAWLAPVSAWNHFPTTTVIDEGQLPLGDLALFAVIAFGGWLGGIWVFRRRDLAA